MFRNRHIANKMTTEKKEILNKINKQILELKNKMLDRIPTMHEIDDGFVVRFFSNWDSCVENNTTIMYKKIPNLNKPDEKVVFFFIPKGAILQHKKREFVGCITCLDGSLEIETVDETIHLERFTKICLDDDEFQGIALENTYLLTTNVK